MRAIGRRLCLVLTLGVAFADTHADVVDLFASMTAALTEDPPNAAGFMKAFDRKMPQYDELSRNIAGILRSWEVGSSIEFLRDEGDGMKRSVDVDWYIELKSRQEDGPAMRRREIVHCELALQNKRWRVVSLRPVSLFKP